MVRYGVGRLPPTQPQIAVLDPLGFGLVLPFRETYFPLGFPAEIETNDERVLEAARRSFGEFSARVDGEPVRLSVTVEPGEGSLPPRVEYRGRNHLLSITCDAQNFAVADLCAGVGCAWIAGAAAANGDWLRHRFLEPLIYSALVQEKLTPVHASCVARHGRGLLLCAPPGTGKSSLAYVCAQHGWTFVTDDAAYLVNADADNTVLGKLGSMRFKASGASLFPELSQHRSAADVHGEPHFEIATAEHPEIAQAGECRVQHVVFLERRPGASPQLTPIAREAALERLSRDIPIYEARVQANHRAALQRLLRHDAFILSYSEYITVIPLLETLVSW